MQCCASCGATEDLRLYEIGEGDRPNRRWWCPGCSCLALRAGVNARRCPVWIERAALHQLPMRPIDIPDSDVPVYRAGRRLGDIRAV